MEQREFNSYGARRGNHEVMVRGTFANIRLRNELVPGTEGGITAHQPGGEVMAIYDAAERYAAEMMPYPHPRSLRALKARAEYYGQLNRVELAEGFILVRGLC